MTAGRGDERSTIVSRYVKHYPGWDGKDGTFENGNGGAGLAPDRRLIFVPGPVRWEQTRKRIIEQLIRYGFRTEDRVCISLALDEILTFSLDRSLAGGRESAAMIAYSISTRVFNVRIRLLDDRQRFAPRRGAEEKDGNPWPLASACMSRVRTARGGTEINMRKENCSAPGAGVATVEDTLDEIELMKEIAAILSARTRGGK